MNPWIQKCAAVVLAAGALTFSFAAQAEEKVQKITFIEDDAQKNMASKIYYLKYTKAGDIAPKPLHKYRNREEYNPKKEA